MIANKHTEMRIFSNLNDLIEGNLSKKELNDKIHRYTFNYIMEYVDARREEEDVDKYDALDELVDYHLHAYEIAKRIRDALLGEVDYLNPKKYTKEYKSNLLEDIEDKVVDNYFNEINKVIKMFLSRDKIDVARNKGIKSNIKEDKEYITQIIKSRFIKAYDKYIQNGETPYDIIKNFEYSSKVRDWLFREVLYSIQDFFDRELTIDEKDKIKEIASKELGAFIKEKKAFEIVEPSKDVKIKIPKTIKWYAISKIWRDILK